MTKPTTIAIVVIALTAGYVGAGNIPSSPGDSVITVSADETWEDVGQDMVHFRGNLEIRTPHWTVTADLATVYGKLEDPQRVVADGSPVQFIYRHSAAGRPSITEGEGRHFEYDRENRILKLTGNVKLATDGRILHSSEIRYDLERQKFQADGAGGVRITIDPDRSGNL